MYVSFTDPLQWTITVLRTIKRIHLEVKTLMGLLYSFFMIKLKDKKNWITQNTVFQFKKHIQMNRIKQKRLGIKK